MAEITTIHLVRHGRVDNPNHVVYGDLPGFDLDETGVNEAHAAGIHLAGRTVGRVVSSPLDRAVHTATAIARRHNRSVTVDQRLREWELSTKWTGRRWEELPRAVPGELDAYLADPTTLPFAFETLSALVDRVTDSIAGNVDRSAETVFVAHQDPIAGAILALTGGNLRSLRDDPPGHGSVTTLEWDGHSWAIAASWEPGPR